MRNESRKMLAEMIRNTKAGDRYLVWGGLEEVRALAKKFAMQGPKGKLP